MKEFARRLSYLFNRRRLDQELAADMEFHREMTAAHGGLPFGNALRLREEARDAWGWTWIERCSQDLRYTWRMLSKSPGFTVTAVLMLALGIGVNLAIFGFFDLMVLRPLPVRDPATILHFQRESPQGGADNFPYAEASFFRQQSKTLSAVFALNFANLTLEGEEKHLEAHLVTANFLSDLGALPKVGRLFDPKIDELPSATPVVVLSQGFWQRRFGADPSIVGKSLRLNSKPVVVIGVVTGEFSGLGLGGPDVWAPISQAPYLFNASHLLTDFTNTGLYVQMWGRLQPGVTPAVAEEELQSLAAELHRLHPNDTWEKERLPSEPGGYALTMGRVAPFFALFAALGLLILVAACITLGSLLLAQGVAREREISIRASVGASKARLVRQFLTESWALALLGAAAGLLLAWFLQRALMLWADAPTWLHPTPDWRVIVFAVGMGFLATFLFGLAPAWQIARQRHRAAKVRQFLLAVQIAASCVLLIVAGLLVRALHHAVTTSPGFAYSQVISIEPNFHGDPAESARLYFDTLRSRLLTVPGVESVALVSNPPLGHRWTVAKTKVAGRSVDIHMNNIDSAFFKTMKIPLLAGRNLRPGDKREIVVSDSLARLEWPGENPVGKRLENDIVVGVVGSARLVSPEDSDAVELYRFAQPDLMPSMVMLVSTTRPAESFAPKVALLAQSVNPRVFPEVQWLEISYRQKTEQAGYAALAVGLLGFVALLLACAGMVGLVAYVVSQRTKEIGIRLALGARSWQILTIVLGQFSRPVIAGLLAGTGLAAALSQLLRQELYGISNFDPTAYLAASVFFVAGVAAAALLPAKRALRIDPLKALRYD